MEPVRLLQGRLAVVTGDITTERVDAIVNAANSSLMGGGGVDGAIHRAGGPAILEECRELRRTRLPKGLAAGEAVATTAGQLRARWVIHTVGPVWGRQPDEESGRLLFSAYRRSLEVARDLGAASIALPAISTGAYGYPKPAAARVAAAALKDFLAAEPTPAEVRLTFLDEREARIFLDHSQLT